MTLPKHMTSRFLNLGVRHSFRTSRISTKAAKPATLRPTTKLNISSYRAGYSTSRDVNPQIQSQPEQSHSTMASDDDYMNFLNKANQDTSEGQSVAAQNKGPPQFKAQDSGSEVPKSIRAVVQNAVYVSEADEPFQGVSLKWNGEGGLPDEGMSVT